MKLVTNDPWEELEQKVRFLKSKFSYPERPSTVEWVETHMSWIFLTDRYAYKLKKPVNFPYLSLDTISKRRINAEREVSVNLALASEIYLGIIPLVIDNDGEMKLASENGNDKVIDWLVLMKRFPNEFTLDQKIHELRTDNILLVGAAHKLSFFYLNSETIGITGEEYLERSKRYVRENSEAFNQSDYGLDIEKIHFIQESQEECLSRYQDLFFQRVKEGRIISAHGDLRPEHICLTNPPLIIDRLEFSAELRTLDPVDELSYFFIECAFLEHPEIGDVFMDVYLKTTHDNPPTEIIQFYQSYRAMLRTRISAWHLDDPRVKDKEKYFRKAEKYLNLAYAALFPSVDNFPEDLPENHPPPPF